MSPYELLRLWEVGLSSVQIGIEGLSTPYLRRMGKGTTTMMNLQLMKTCYELGIWNVGCNLMIRFPGATGNDVAETVQNIEAYALGYQPLTVNSFRLLGVRPLEWTDQAADLPVCRMSVSAHFAARYRAA